jgi:hypothetical protein
MAPEPMYFINASDQSVCVYMCIPLSLLGNGSVKTLLQQRLYAWTNLYVTLYVYDDTWAHINGVQTLLR